MVRRRLLVQGTVQGVGFRPHVLRRARALGLSGFVLNAGGQVVVEAQGAAGALDTLEAELRAAPPPACVTSLDARELDEVESEQAFVIAESELSAPLPALPADLAPCPECSAEFEASQGRRAGYAFTACTRCGARYSIVEALPYDRAGTTLREFPPCPDCQGEYQDVTDRRFHAQAIACPSCGPTLELLDSGGRSLGRGQPALTLAAGRLREGAIVALKGIGGFQLLADAHDAGAIERLRSRKRREEKPFAVLFADLEGAAAHALLSVADRALLVSPEAPIVLAERRPGSELAAAVAPDNPQLGCLLPASPLHRLLARAVGRPLVCTSGNLSGEPLCLETAEALERLSGLADCFLVHDRAIARPLDDSVARAGPAGPMLLRRARGYAPRVVARLASERCVLALGAELKSAPSLLLGGSLILGQHVGDLGDARTLLAFERNTADLLRFFAAKPDAVACDLHPDYASTRHAEKLAKAWGVPLVRVQHHHAHVAAVAAEHGLTGPVLGIAWDGTGLGSDGTVWGGEVLVVDGPNLRRVAHLPKFPLPGGDRAAREPWRSALGVLFAVDPELARAHGRRFLEQRELDNLLRALAAGVNAPLSSSAGRLFDAVAALIGCPARINFEGQAAMQLEFAARASGEVEGYPLELQSEGTASSLRPLVEAVLADIERGRPAAEMAARFHAALIDALLRSVRRFDVPKVVLSGGCFQNQLLLVGLSEKLAAEGRQVFLPGQVPCNDGGISAGQAAVAAWHGSAESVAIHPAG